MPEDMPSSWKYISSASSRVSSLGKDYLNAARSKAQARLASPGLGPDEGRKSWRAWAGQKLKIRRSQSDTNKSNETLNLFPGWAVRRYRKPGAGEVQGAFEVEVFVSGFAISHRSLENASRSQRAFIRLAKGFAALPKVTADAIEPRPAVHLSPSTEALLGQKTLPPRPTEITDDYMIETLERQLRESNNTAHSDSDSGCSSEDLPAPEEAPGITIVSRSQGSSSLPADALRKLHENLESRLQPFWSSVLSSRSVRIHLFASPHHYTSPNETHHPSEAEDEHEATEDESKVYGPVGGQDVVTGPDGSFQARFLVKWEDLCHHPGALHIAFGDQLEEHDLLIAAQILPAAPAVDVDEAQSEIPISPIKTLRIPITHCPIRVISDIDDTVKLSNVVSGARAVFQSVFVKDLTENIIPGMGEWYTAMWKKGVRFHYVSNGPFELLPIVNEFFQISHLPPGRSLFNGLLSAPATRKRAGVIDVLDSFPESRFILIGDTGEQDMELYAEIARERPHQIIAVFVRDVESGDPIDDPTGWKALGATGPRAGDDRPRPRSRRTLSGLLNSSRASSPPLVPPLLRSSSAGQGGNGGEYFTSTPITAEPEALLPLLPPRSAPAANTAVSMTAGPPPAPSAYFNSSNNPGNSFVAQDGSIVSRSSSVLSSASSTVLRIQEAEKRRSALQARVYLARTQMPGHVPLRVFRNPSECVEADQVLVGQANVVQK
ncbi:hypothetical protein H0H92_013735 [Tricholoma furcatifolium]|nr:hypothetical protein H0H92_013735 [Tricholoma furcatifolium]